MIVPSVLFTGELIKEKENMYASPIGSVHDEEDKAASNP